MKKFFIAGVCVVLCSSVIKAAVWYVNAARPDDSGNGTSWATAKKTIQAAIDLPGVVGDDVILVTNGVYDTGGRPHTGEVLTNRVYLNKAITVRSVNGPSNTFIVGRWNNPAGSTWSDAIGDAAARCVYMAAGSKLIGFTLTNGATCNRVFETVNYGGGVYGAGSASVVVSNCIFVGNYSGGRGGGAGVYGATVYNSTMLRNIASPIWDGGSGGGASSCVLYNCLLKANSAGYSGGGAQASTLYNCDILESGTAGGQLYGSAADQSTLYNCNVISNVGNAAGVFAWSWDENTTARTKAYNCFIAWNRGNSSIARNTTFYNCTILYNTGSAGIYKSELYNSLLVGNAVSGGGGGAAVCRLYNCTVTGNSAAQNAGGVLNSTNWNCIVYSNHSGSNNPAFHNYSNCVFNYSCTLPDPGAGDGNITNEPMFKTPGSGYGLSHVLGNYRLSGGACINSGTNFGYMTDPATNEYLRKDLDGKPRISHGTADMGAYEARAPKGSIIIFRGN